MFYNNPYSYQPMTYQQQIQQLQQQTQQIPQPQIQQQPQVQNSGIFFFVNSQKEVDEWVLNAGQTAFFFDRNNPIFYIKSVAQNGLSQPVEVYDYTQRETHGEALENDFKAKADQYVTKEEFNQFKAEIEKMRTEAEG